MEIAVNTRLLLPNKLEGIGRFCWESLRRLAEMHPEHNFHLLFDRKYDEQFITANNMIPHVVHPQARHPFLYMLWFNFAIPRKLKSLNADLFLSPDGYCSLNTKVKQLAVIHDLNFEHRPADLPLKDRLYYQHYFPKFAQVAQRIATVSEYSKQDLVNSYKVSEDKVDVVYNGVSDCFQPQSSSPKPFTNSKPYFLFVGSLHPRKNLVNLVKAYQAYRKKEAEPHELLIVGTKMWDDDFLAGEEHSEGVHFSGRITDEQLAEVYSNAEAFVFPSYFEGFGIPLVEAMACGCPVISSNATCMPEIAGDAALYFHPDNIEELSDLLSKMHHDQQLSASLKEKGLERAKIFTWERTAQLLSESMQKCLS